MANEPPAPKPGDTVFWIELLETCVLSAEVKSVDKHGYVHFNKGGQVVPPAPRHLADCALTPLAAVDQAESLLRRCIAAAEETLAALSQQKEPLPCRMFTFRPEALALAHAEATRSPRP